MRDDLLAKAAQIKAEALAIDTTKTETIKMRELRVGDVVVAVGPEGKRFPFPFTLNKVQYIERHRVVMLTATHGWFNARPYPADDPVVVVVR